MSLSLPLTLINNKPQKARVELALGYLQQNDFVQAKLNLDKALEHDERYYLVHSALAHFYQLQGDTEKRSKLIYRRLS